MTYTVALTSPDDEDLGWWDYADMSAASARYNLLAKAEVESGTNNAITVYRDGEEIDM